MKKLGYIVAALGAIALAAPSIASAETVVVRHSGHHWDHARAEYRMHDHDWRGGWHHHDHDRVMIRDHRY